MFYIKIKICSSEDSIKRMREDFSLYVHPTMVFISRMYKEFLKISKKETDNALHIHQDG